MIDLRRRAFLALLLGVLSISFLLAPYSIQSANALPSSIYKTRIEIVGRNVVFPNEAVDILPSSNFTQILVQIYDSASNKVYEAYKTANVSFSYIPPIVYGMFTVKASIEDSSSETWFWLQDKSNLSLAPNEILWVWNGINYKLSIRRVS